MLKSCLGLLVIALFGLSACKQDQTSVTLDASDELTASAASAFKGIQTLSSKDGKLSIVVDGDFSDEIDDPDSWVDEADQGSLILLQHDDSKNITLVANDLGPLHLKADEYFKNLADSLNNNSTINNVKTGIATENRMNYRFSHTKNDVLLNENCVAMVGNNNLYSVCASSDSAQDDELAAALKTINLQNN